MPQAAPQTVIVFDLDGTLVDTAPDLLDALDHAIGAAGLPPVDQAAMRAYAGHGGRAMIERAFALNRRPLATDERERLLALFLEHYTSRMPGRSALFPGAIEALTRFEEAGFPLAVCTNKFERLARQLLERLDLAHRFAMIAGADTFAGQVPLILKMNSANSLAREKEAPTQAVTASVQDALRLGCSAVGFTIYPGSDDCYDMMEMVRELSEEARAVGLAVVVWSYPRGGNLSKDGETAVDVVAYAAHMAALLGANIIKVKLPSAHLENPDAKKVYEKEKIDISTQAARVAHVVQSLFGGRRIVVFSGGAAKGENAVFDDARAIRDGGGNGSIIGRNTFQRQRDDARAMLDELVKIYKGQD